MVYIVKVFWFKGEDSMKNKAAKQMNFKEIAAYSLGLFGFQAIIGLLNSYQAAFYEASMGANIATVAIIILIAKLASAVFDPVVGSMIERGKSKKGKLRPFILYSVAPLLVFTVLIFIKVPFTGTGLYAYIFITYLLWSMAMTLGDVPSQGIASVLTTNTDERTNVVSIANTFKQIGFSACVVVVPVICLIVPGGSRVFGYEGEKDSAISSTEYLWIAVAVSVLGCALFSLIYFINKERVPYSPEKMTYREMFSALKNNKPLMLVIISYFLGFGRQMSMGIQVQTSNALLGSENYVAALGITTAIGSMISMAIVPVMVKKLDERKTYIIMSVYGFAISMITFFVGTSHPVPMFICLFLTGLQFGAVTLLPMLMTADCVDYYEYKTGKRAEGAAYAVLTLTIKVCLAMSTALGLIFISASGYKADTAVFTESTKSIVYFAYTAMPGILALLSVFPIFGYDLVGEKKKSITAALAQSRAEKAQVKG